MSISTDRRRSRRASVYLPVESCRPGQLSEDKAVVGRTEDIGPSGLRVRLDKLPELKEGDEVYVRVDTLKPGEAIELCGQVRWIRPHSDSETEWEIGIKLANMDLDEWDRWMEVVPAI